MGTRLIQPGLRRVADAAFPNSSFPAQLVADGFTGFATYLSSPTSNGKNWSPTRIAWFRDSGLGLIMFCEQNETIVLGGYSAANVQLARQCEAMADAFGYPKDCPMWYAVDISPFGHENEIVEAFRAYKDNSSRPLGAYAGSQMIDRLMAEGLIEYGHIPSAASWSETSAPQNGTTVVFGYRDNSGRVHNMYITPNAHMRQHPSEPYSGSRIDANDVLKAFPAWFPAEPDNPTPPPEISNAMPAHIVYVQTPNGVIYEIVACCDGKPRYRTTPNEGAAVFACHPNGVPAASDQALSALESFDPQQEANRLAAYLRNAGGAGGAGGASPEAIADELSRRLARDA
jgi:hypothetical protein